jgi:hypothetical protein
MTGALSVEERTTTKEDPDEEFFLEKYIALKDAMHKQDADEIEKIIEGIKDLSSLEQLMYYKLSEKDDNLLDYAHQQFMSYAPTKFGKQGTKTRQMSEFWCHVNWLLVNAAGRKRPFSGKVH